MESQLAVEAPETIAATESCREAVFVPIAAQQRAVYEDPDFGDAIKAETEIRRLAPEYHLHYNRSKRAASDAETVRDLLAYQFAIYKAIHVGTGRDGNWGPFITELGFKVRTVDRWVEQKLATGELPDWVATRLVANQRPELKAAPEQPEHEKPYTLLIHFSDVRKKLFAEAANKFDEDTLAEVIFEAVTTHPVALAPKRRMTWTDETEVSPEPTTLLEQMEQEATAGASA